MSEQTGITAEMIRLYDDYTHVTLDRRGFLERLAALAGSAPAALALVPLLEASSAAAAVSDANDPRLDISRISWPGAGSEIRGYLVRPKAAAGKLAAVMLVHENRGLNGHIDDVARRLALEGFIVLAPDFLSPSGGTPADEDKARDLIAKLDRVQLLGNAVATLAYLKGLDGASGKTGAVGFCWGGGLVNLAATAVPELGAGVAYYGMQPDAAAASHIKAKLLLHYAGLDDRTNAGIGAYDAALKAAGVEHQIYVYAGVNHAFNNDTSAARYDKAAAELAWGRTVAFLKAALG